MKTIIGPAPAIGKKVARFSTRRSTSASPAVWPMGELMQRFEISDGRGWLEYGRITARGGIAIDERTGEEFDSTWHEVMLPPLGAMAIRAVIEHDAPLVGAKVELK